MPFWRPETMNSKNIFDKSFWSSKNLFGPSELELLRQEMLARVMNIIPNQLCDPQSGELIEEPVFTPYGNVFNRKTLLNYWALEKNINIQNTTCPLTDKPLSDNNLLKPQEVPELARWFKEIKEQYISIKKKISTMQQKDKETIQADIEYFRNFLNEMAVVVELRTKALRNTNSIKENLKLDLESTENLLYWNNITLNQLCYYLPYLSNCMLNLTGHELVKDKSDHAYIISNDIMNMMRTTKVPYSSDNDLVNALQNTIDQSKRNWRYRMFCCLRNRHEKELLAADDIKSVRLDSPFNQ